MKNKELDYSSKIYRFLWTIFYYILFRFTPVFFHQWRCFVLNLFGAKVKYSAHIYPSVKIFNPKMLKMGENSCLAPNTICFNVAMITLGDKATISQNCHLCSASRKYNDFSMSLVSLPIIIEKRTWVAADSFIGPGVKVKECSVVLARSVVLKNIPSYSIVQGNPAIVIGQREEKI